MYKKLKLEQASLDSLVTGEEEYTKVIIDSQLSDRPRIYVVIPCYNEELSLPMLVDDLSRVLSRGTPFKIIAINDGSSDKTELTLKNLAKKYPILLLQHARNLGLSAALKDGLLYAATITQPNDFVITMDGDNTHKSHYIRDMIEASRYGADIVIASRYVSGGLQTGVSNDRILLSKCINYFLPFWSGLKIRDVTSGYRCYRASLLKKGFKKYNSHFVCAKGFEVQVELLVKLSSVSKAIHEIPFELRYGDKRGKSKMRLLETIQNYFLLTLKILMWRLAKES